MLSEGALHAKRICWELAKFSKARGIPEHDLEDIAYILLVALILRDERRTGKYLPASHAKELESLISDILDVGDPSHVEGQLQGVRDLLAAATNTRPESNPRETGRSALAIRHIAGMLAHELRDLDRNGRIDVSDALFYKQFARLAPSHPRHHALVARFALPLIDLHGGVSESQPGPGEVFVITGMPDQADFNYQQRHARLPDHLTTSLRFIRNLRLVAYDIAFQTGNVIQTPTALSVIDTSFDFGRSAYGEVPVIYSNAGAPNDVLGLRRERASPMLVVAGVKDRRLLKRSAEARRELVEYHGLRAVVDFGSFNSKAMTTLSFWYFGPPFPGFEDRIAHIDARQLRPNAKSDEMLSCATLVGTLLRIWSEGETLSKSRMEETGAPRRIIAFVEEAFSGGNTLVPGFARFVTRHEMSERDYSLRAEDYVGRNDDHSWRPDVEINPILARLREHRQGSAVFLIGDNGAGKSLAMRDTAMALALEGHHSFGVSFGSTDRFERSPRAEPLSSHFTYAGARSFRSGPNVQHSLGELGDMVKDIYRNTQRLDCFEAALDTLGFRPRQFLVPVEMTSTSDPLERLLADVHPLSTLSTTERERQDLNRWQTLPDGVYKLAFIRRDSPEIVVFNSLSSGEQQILTMVIKIVAKVQRDMTVLLDEPEISLHVAWQRQLPQILREFSRRLGCSFVVATHSPVVIASATDLDDHCFVMRDRRLYELKADQRRSVESSLFEGFETYTPYTHHVQERCAEIVSRLIGESDENGLLHDETTILDELKLLKQRLDEVKGMSSTQDIVLVDKAIIAVQEILAQ
ncbi:AAA family ATPase [Paraburkholderia caribensis]|uniref:AAA family ATPase n=1 Tax=Paraburkholderia caribensis TaxID=75105 RepID=UPI001CAB46FE|nr:AAA family ATPase [Paraburkholderia caribensis]CAG9243848.1 hypothetical protein PCAR4_140091 [Paraburkholderia caribensis]